MEENVGIDYTWEKRQPCLKKLLYVAGSATHPGWVGEHTSYCRKTTVVVLVEPEASAEISQENDMYVQLFPQSKPCRNSERILIANMQLPYNSIVLCIDQDRAIHHALARTQANTSPCEIDKTLKHNSLQQLWPVISASHPYLFLPTEERQIRRQRYQDETAHHRHDTSAFCGFRCTL